MTAMVNCKECRADEKYIFFKHVYRGYKDNVWIAECQRCYTIVPVVSYAYDIEKLIAAWNEAQTNKRGEG